MSPHLGSSACPCVTPGPSLAFFSISDAEKVNGTIGYRLLPSAYLRIEMCSYNMTQDENR